MKTIKGIVLALAVLGTVGLRSESDLGAWSRTVRQGSWQTGRLATIAADSRTRFEQDQTDYEARLTYAVATLGQLGESEAFQTFARQFGFTVDYLGLSFQGEATDATKWPSVNDLVDAAAEEGLPVLEDALSVLEVIPDTWNGTVRLAPTDYPVDEETLVDIGDVQYARAGLEAAIGLLYFAAGYDLTLDWPKAKAAFDYRRTIPSVATAPSLTTDAGWDKAVRGRNDTQFLFSGSKLFLRLNRAEGFATTNALDYLYLEMKNASTGADYGFDYEDWDGDFGYQVWFNDGTDPAPRRKDYFKGFDWDAEEFNWDDYFEREERYQAAYEAWDAVRYRPNVTIQQNETSIVAVIDLTEKPALTTGGMWTVDEGESEIRTEYNSWIENGHEYGWWDYDSFLIEINSDLARACRMLMEQDAFAAKVRDLDSLATSKAWMACALSQALAADKSVLARPADGPFHFIEYDPKDTNVLALARELTGQALAALESEQEFDAWRFADLSEKAEKYISLLPNDGLVRVYLGALFSGKITKDLLPTIQQGADEEPVPVVETVPDPTLAGLLPGMTLGNWVTFAKDAGVTLAHVPVTVRLDASGGSVEPTVLTLTHNPETEVTSLGELPTPTRMGYTFAGWFTAADGGTQVSEAIRVSANVTYYAHWMVNYAGTVDVTFAQAQTVTGALYDKDNALAGTVQVKVGKISRKGQVKVSASATLMNGKKITARAASLTVGANNVVEGQLVFKAPVGELTFAMAADGRFTLKNDLYQVVEAEIGGSLSNGSHAFALKDFDLTLDGLQDQLLPNGETITVTGGKWTCAKAATVKWTKDKVTKEFGLEVDESGGKTNRSALKLSYVAKTGIFKGSFKAYALEEKNGKTKLVKYTVNVFGFVVDGKGIGQASIKKPVAGPWVVMVE